MTEQPDPADAPPALPALKIVEPEVKEDDPWGDDVLDRKEIADRLTSIVRGQDEPFVISLDGRWGTGKTFLLRRWRQALENDGWQAIYYNSWEDDFAGDPLLSITGQLSGHFEEGGFAATLRALAHLGPTLVDLAAPFTPYGPVWTFVRGAARRVTRKQAPPERMRRYLDRRATTDEFRRELATLGAEVRKETGQPLLFIIDELDRCRPTFAIELLERVKHIFDVKNIVFVFGINRSELTKSLESIYGKIDSGTYLRRFFDMEFILPDADPTRFCRHLLVQYQIPERFQALSETVGGEQRIPEFRMLSQYLPVLLGNMGMAPREMDYCVRLIALTLRGLEGRYPLHPALFILLVALKVTRPTLYRRFVEGTARGGEVIDYLDSLTPAGLGGTEHLLLSSGGEMERAAAAIYAADGADAVQAQLQALMLGKEPEQREYLSQTHARLQREDSSRLMRIRGLVQEYSNDNNRYGASVGYLAELIDLYSDFTRPR